MHHENGRQAAESVKGVCPECGTSNDHTPAFASGSARNIALSRRWDGWQLFRQLSILVVTVRRKDLVQLIPL